MSPIGRSISATVLVNGREVDDFSYVTRSDPIPVPTTGGSTIDHGWTFFDAAGHYHGADEDGDHPTLRLVYDEAEWCPDCREDHDRTHYECRLCGETIEIGTKYVGPTNGSIPGPIDHELTVTTKGTEPWWEKGQRVSVVLKFGGSPVSFGTAVVAGFTFRGTFPEGDYVDAQLAVEEIHEAWRP